MALRRECRAYGPIGYMLESAHLQGAQIDGDGRLMQFNQPTIDIINEPYQDLKTLLQEAFERNRTRAAEGARKEHEGLKEVDAFATKGEVGKLDGKDKMILNVIRTGSMWTKENAFWAGHDESAM